MNPKQSMSAKTIFLSQNGNNNRAYRKNLMNLDQIICMDNNYGCPTKI
jgi:hypothetical protein